MSYQTRLDNDYATRIDQTQRDDEYARLVSEKTRIEKLTANWMTDGTVLLGKTTDPAERSDLTALRAELIANLRTVLGI